MEAIPMPIRSLPRRDQPSLNRCPQIRPHPRRIRRDQPAEGPDLSEDRLGECDAGPGDDRPVTQGKELDR